jgi:hypothetical protein
VDLFAEWTDDYQTSAGKKAITAGEVVFDCYYCQGPLQLVVSPLSLAAPLNGPTEYRVARRKRSRCDAWLRSQHPGETLSQVIERAEWHHQGKWAFDGYNWEEGDVHRHGADAPLSPDEGTP